MTDIFPCQNCGKKIHINKLDGKPERLAGPGCSVQDILDAMDTGEEFDRLECVDCYGPAYVALS